MAPDALKKAGYDVDDIRYLDFFIRGYSSGFQWNKGTRSWEWFASAPVNKKGKPKRFRQPF